MSVYANSYFLYIYLFVAIIIGWYYHVMGKTYIKKHDAMTLLFIEALTVLVCVSVYLAYKHKLSYLNFHKDLHKISISDYIIFLGFAVYGIFASFFGLSFLEHHDVAKIRLADFIIGIPITAVGLHIYSSEKLTTEKIIGVIAVLSGGYMYLK